MDLIIKARLHNLFRAKDFNDKKGNGNLQFLDEQRKWRWCSASSS